MWIASIPIRRGYSIQSVYPYFNFDKSLDFVRITAKHGTGDLWDRFILPDAQLMEVHNLSSSCFYRAFDIERQPGKPLFWADDEAQADELAELGLMATSILRRQSLKADQLKAFSAVSKHVIWPANSVAARQSAIELKDSLEGVGRNVSIVDAETIGVGDGEGVLDWFAKNPAALADRVLQLPPLPAIKKEPTF